MATAVEGPGKGSKGAAKGKNPELALPKRSGRGNGKKCGVDAGDDDA